MTVIVTTKGQRYVFDNAEDVEVAQTDKLSMMRDDDLPGWYITDISEKKEC